MKLPSDEVAGTCRSGILHRGEIPPNTSPTLMAELHSLGLGVSVSPLVVLVRVRSLTPFPRIRVRLAAVFIVSEDPPPRLISRSVCSTSTERVHF